VRARDGPAVAPRRYLRASRARADERHLKARLPTWKRCPRARQIRRTMPSREFNEVAAASPCRCFGLDSPRAARHRRKHRSRRLLAESPAAPHTPLNPRYRPDVAVLNRLGLARDAGVSFHARIDIFLGNMRRAAAKRCASV